MKINNKKLSLILIFLIITLITITMLSIFKKTPEIKEIKKLSSSSLNEFTFEYPIFEEWKEKIIEDNNEKYVVVFSHVPSKSNSEIYAEIKMEITKKNINTLPKIFLENPQGIKYQGDLINSFPNKPITESQNYVQFYIKDSIVKVELSVNCEDYVFSSKKFFNKVIKSFRTLEKPIKNQ